MSINFLKWHKNICCKPLLYNVLKSYNHFHTQVVLFKFIKYNPVQQAKLAQKFLAKNEHLFKKRVKDRSNENDNAKILASTVHNKPIENYHPRLQRLNKIFMEKITDIISTSEHFSAMINKGFEVTQIMVQPGLSSINIYWYCSRTENVEFLGNTVLKLTPFIRQELCNQRVIGRIPPIFFFKDDIIKNAEEVDKLLKIADFGPDYEKAQSDAKPCLIEVPVIQKQLSNEIWEELDTKAEEDNKEETLDEDVNQFPDDILTIKQDVFGVNREKIMQMVRKGHKDSKALHRQTEEDYSIPQEPDVKMVFTSHSRYSHSRASEIKKWVSLYKKTRKGNLKQERIKEQNNLVYSALLQEHREREEQKLESDNYLEEYHDYDDDDNDFDKGSNYKDYDYDYEKS